jgi:homoserine kinase type II
MAVYTTVERQEVERFIEPFGIGPLIHLEGVAEGTENSNYFITTDQSGFPSELHTQPLRHYVLTLFENAAADDLEFYIKLTSLLSLRGLPVPSPLKDADGVALHYLQDKPVLLIPRVEGQAPLQPNEQQCKEIGLALAQIHKISLDSKFEHQSPNGLSWLERCAEQLRPLLDPTDQVLLDEIPRFTQLSKKHSNLLQAITHNDFLKENTIFQSNQLAGIINFNNAGSGFLMMDLAITVNDWCSSADGSFDGQLTSAVLKAYQEVRSITNDEMQLWNDFLRIAAAKIWLLRIYAQLLPECNHKTGALIEPKSPTHYKNILLQRIHCPQAIS